jgi:hypothetical protein
MASSSNEVVTLNVGGTMYTTTATTLLGLASAGSMLARLVSLHLDTKHSSAASSSAGGCGATGSTSAPDSSTDSANNVAGIAASLTDPCLAGALFIDHDGPLFAYVLSYLRNGGDLVPPADITICKQLLQEAMYYGIEGMVPLLQKHLQQLKLLERSRQQMINSTSAWQSEVQHSLHMLLNQQEGAVDIRKCLSENKDLLDGMHLYLTPVDPYHRGKRGGPNYNKPHTLQGDLVDIEAKLQDLLDK